MCIEIFFEVVNTLTNLEQLFPGVIQLMTFISSTVAWGVYAILASLGLIGKLSHSIIHSWRLVHCAPRNITVFFGHRYYFFQACIVKIRSDYTFPHR